MKIYGYPYGDNSCGSARVRFHRIFAAMKNVEILPTPLDADLVYIQKRADNETIDLAHKCHDMGIPLVYDLDDAPGQCAAIYLEETMFSLATLITTDTMEKLSLFSTYASTEYGKKVRIVEDCLDYWDEPPEFQIRTQIKTVITFGWDHSAMAAIPYMLSLRNVFPELQFKYITNKFLFPAERILFVKWSPETVKEKLLAADMGLFCHPSDKNGELRPATRLITAMAAGLPSIALNSKGHQALLKIAGKEQLLFSSVEESKNKLKSLSPYSIREEISKSCKSFAWGNYAPAIVAAKFRAIFEEAINA